MQSRTRSKFSEKKGVNKHIAMQGSLASYAHINNITASTAVAESDNKTTLTATPCINVTTYALQPPL